MTAYFHMLSTWSDANPEPTIEFALKTENAHEDSDSWEE